MKNNFKPSADKGKRPFSKNSNPSGQKFKSPDYSGKPKKYGNSDTKQNSYKHTDGNAYSSDRDNRDNRNSGERENNRYAKGNRSGGYSRDNTGYQGNRDNAGYKGNRDNTGYKGNRDNTGYKGNRDNTGYKGNRDNAGYKGNRDNTGYQGNRDNTGYKGNRDNTGYKGNRDNTGYKGNRDNAGYQGSNRDNAGYKGNRDNAGYKGNRDNAGYQGNRDNTSKKFSRGTYDARDNNKPKFQTQKKYTEKQPYRKDIKNVDIDIKVKDVKPGEFDNSGDARDTESMIFGRNAVLELLKSDRTIDKIFVQANQREGSITVIVAEAVRKSIPVVEVEKQKLDKMTNGTAHQGVVAFTSEIEYCSVDDILAVAEERNEKPFILIADKIMDAHNLGAIIRTAECAGVHGVIIPKRHAAGVSSVVSKVSAGALFHIKISKVANIASTIEYLKEKGVWTFASTSDAMNDNIDSREENEKDSNEVKEVKEVKNYCEVDYNLPLCLAVGNEGDGLAPIMLNKSDFLINIPLYGKIESLNVSCATAVLLYEITRQRKQKDL